MNQQSATTFGSSSALWRGIRNHTLWDISRKYRHARARSTHTHTQNLYARPNLHPFVKALRYIQQTPTFTPFASHPKLERAEFHTALAWPTSAETREHTLVLPPWSPTGIKGQHSATPAQAWARGHAHILLLTQTPIPTSPTAVQAALRVWEAKRTQTIAKDRAGGGALSGKLR